VNSARGGPLLLALTSVGVVTTWAVPQSIALPAAPLRVAALLGAVVLGTAISRRIGLEIAPHGAGRPALRGTMIGMLFGVYIALADGIVFRAHLPAGQVASVTALPAWERIAVFVPLVVVDELVYRLCLVSLLAWVLGAGRRNATAIRISIVVTALAYVVLHLRLVTGGGPLTPILATRELALHVTAGVLWGYLFWRNGLTTAVVAHMGAHVTLQAGLGLLLR